MKKFTEFKPQKRIFEQEANELKPSVEKTEQFQEEVVKSEPVKFFSKLFESREMAHMYHLRTQGDGSFALHSALNEYYEGVGEDAAGSILPFLDSLVEVYQGQYDLVSGWDIIDKKAYSEEQPLQYFLNLAEFIKKYRYTSLSQEDAHIQAIVDEILIIVYKLIYKMRFLK
jgi:hypothetical protein